MQPRAPRTKRAGLALLLICTVAVGLYALWQRPPAAEPRPLGALDGGPAPVAEPLATGSRRVLVDTTVREGSSPSLAGAGANELDERVAAAVGDLAQDLRRERCELPAWSVSARSAARRLGGRAEAPLLELLGRGGLASEERIAAAELLRQLARLDGQARVLPPLAEVELSRLVENAQAEPRLATAAAAAHAQLGGPRALDYWIRAALGEFSGPVAQLSLRALSELREPSAIEALCSALESAHDAAGRERLAIALGAIARSHSSDADDTALRERVCAVLSGLAAEATAPDGLRRRALGSLGWWKGEAGAAPGDAANVFIAAAEPFEVERARYDVQDHERSADLRRRDVQLLAAAGFRESGSLMQVLRFDPAPEVRSAAAAALAQFEGESIRIALQEAAASDPSAAVRRQAQLALNR